MATQVISKLRADDTDPDTYSDIKLWEDDIPPDLVTPDEQWVLECYNDWPAGYQIDTSVYITERVCSETNNVVITAPDAEKYKAVTGGACLFICNATGFILQNDYVDISHCRFELLRQVAGGAVISWSTTSPIGVKVHHNVMDDKTSTTTVPIYDNSSAGNGEVYNNLIVKTGPVVNFAHAIRMRGSASQLYNNVGIGFHRTYRADSNGSTAYNNIAYGFTDYGFEGTLSGDNNASQDDSAPGANSVQNITSAEFVNYTGDMAGDYHLASNSQLKGAGYNLVENALQSSPQYDIDGDQWPNAGVWDIGFDYETGGAPPGETINGSGALASEKAILAGTGSVAFGITGSGDLLTQKASLVGGGKAFFEAHGAGQLAVKQALLSGAGTAFSVITGAGGLVTELIELLGSGTAYTPSTDIQGNGNLLAALVELDGSGQVSYTPQEITGSGQLTVLKTELDGSGRILETIIGTGDLGVALTELVGSGSLIGNIYGSGNFTIPTTVLFGEGTANSTITGDGDLQITMPVLRGYGGEDIVSITEVNFTLRINKEMLSTLCIKKEYLQ